MTKMRNDLETNYEIEMSNVSDDMTTLEEDQTELQNENDDENSGNIATHRYNLRPRQTKHHEKLNIMRMGHQPTYTDNMKLHLNVLMMQMRVKARI